MDLKKPKKKQSARIYITLTMVICFLLIFVLQYFAFTSSMKTLLDTREFDSMRSQLDLAESVLSISMEDLPKISSEWASLSYTYSFAAFGDDTIYKNNFVPDYAYDQNKVNFLIVLDLNHEILFEKFYRYRESKQVEPTNLSALYGEIGEQALATFSVGGGEGFSGFLWHDGYPYYLSAYPISDVRNASPAAGTLIFGRLIDDEELDGIFNTQGMSLEIIPTDSLAMSDSEATLFVEDGIFTRQTEDMTAAYGALYDVDGNPSLTLHVTNDRTAYAQGRSSVNSVLFILFLACGVILLLLQRLIRKMILDPLTTLSHEVNTIDVDSSTDCISQQEVNTEMSMLTSSVNGMLARIREDHRLIQKANETLSYSANYDFLTGLRNRSNAISSLVQMIEQSDAATTQVTVFYFDISRFKTTNDALGHTMGDTILQQVASRMQDEFREEAFLARMSGDKFIVATPLLHTDEARHVYVTRINSIFELPFSVKERSIDLTISMGSSTWPTDADTADALLKNAELAMYKSKDDSCTGRYLAYHESFQEQLQRKLYIENRLRSAIHDGCTEFQMYYQPKISVHANQIERCEALLRWNSPTGLIGPGEFIPLAEETGLIVPLTWWVISDCCKAAKYFEDNGCPMVVSINIPAQVLMHEDFLNRLRRSIEESSVDARRLDIEITEGTLLVDLDRVNQVFTQLHKMGLEISVDDFGTGYSSLSYLNNLAVDRIKVDRSFISQIDKSADSRALVRAIIAMAKSLHFVVTAEGVEEPKQYNILRDFVCDEVQGYIVSRPVPCETYLDFCKDWDSGDTSFYSEDAST